MNPRLHAWMAQGRWLQWRQQRYFVRQGGQGPNMLLLHGYPVGSYDWHALWPHLTPHYTLFAPDLLGHGFSDKPPGADYSVPAHADAVDALLQQLGVRHCHVLAFDLGVSVVQEMLARRIDGQGAMAQIDSVTLLNGGLCPEAYQPRWLQRLLVSPLGPWLSARVSKPLFEKTIRRMYGDHPPAQVQMIDDFWALVQHGGGTALAHAIGAFWHTRMQHSARYVQALLQPGLRLRLINGSADPNSGAHMVRAFLRHHPDADVVRLDTLGHWPHVQDPQAVARAVIAFATPSPTYQQAVGNTTRPEKE